MSQLSSDGVAGRILGDRQLRMFAWVAFVMVAGAALAVAVQFGLSQPSKVTTAGDIQAPISLTRADDYGLRLADANTITLARADDYGLRLADANTISLARTDDYGLRLADAGAVNLTRNDDYGLRH